MAKKSEVSQLAREIATRRLRQENISLKTRLSEAMAALEQCKFELNTAVKGEKAKESVKPIRIQVKKDGRREATWVALASDWHIEETVRPETVNGVNSYNLAIARRRAQRYFE